MTLRIETSRKRGPHDPRWPNRPGLAAPQHAIEERTPRDTARRIAIAITEAGTAQWEADGGTVR